MSTGYDLLKSTYDPHAKRLKVPHVTSDRIASSRSCTAFNVAEIPELLKVSKFHIFGFNHSLQNTSTEENI